MMHSSKIFVCLAVFALALAGGNAEKVNEFYFVLLFFKFLVINFGFYNLATYWHLL